MFANVCLDSLVVENRKQMERVIPSDSLSVCLVYPSGLRAARRLTEAIFA